MGEMKSLRGPKPRVVKTKEASLGERAHLTRNTVIKQNEDLQQSKVDIHLLGDVIETLKGDLARMKKKHLALTDRNRKVEHWALDLERRAVKAEHILGTVNKVFKSTHNSNLSAQLQSTKRILEKLMTVTDRENKKDTAIKNQLAATKSSEGLNRINELEAENAGYKRKINKLFKALAASLKQMKDMKPKKTENERMAELLKGNFDLDDDDDDGDNAEENLALEAIEAVKQTSHERSIKTKRCEHCGSNYLIDGSSAKNIGIEAIIKQSGDSFLKTKQDLLLAKAQLKAFKINIKHVTKENERFRSAIEYLKAKLQMNNLDVSADYGEVLGGAGIGMASVFGLNETTNSARLGLHIDIDDPTTTGENTGRHTGASSPLRGPGSPSHAPFYPTSSHHPDEPFLFVPYEVDATPDSPGSLRSPRSPTRLGYTDLSNGAGGAAGGAATGQYGLPLSDSERFYLQELKRSTTSPTSKYLLSLDHPGHAPERRAGGGWGTVGPSNEEKRDSSHAVGAGGVTYTPGTAKKEFDLGSAILASEAKLDRLHTIYKTI